MSEGAGFDGEGRLATGGFSPRSRRWPRLTVTVIAVSVVVAVVAGVGGLLGRGGGADQATVDELPVDPAPPVANEARIRADTLTQAAAAVGPQEVDLADLPRFVLPEPWELVEVGDQALWTPEQWRVHQAWRQANPGTPTDRLVWTQGFVLGGQNLPVLVPDVVIDVYQSVGPGGDDDEPAGDGLISEPIEVAGLPGHLRAVNNPFGALEIVVSDDQYRVVLSSDRANPSSTADHAATTWQATWTLGSEEVRIWVSGALPGDFVRSLSSQWVPGSGYKLVQEPSGRILYGDEMIPDDIIYSIMLQPGWLRSHTPGSGYVISVYTGLDSLEELSARAILDSLVEVDLDTWRELAGPVSDDSRRRD